MLVVSGMKPGPSGVGRLMTCLVEDAATRAKKDVQIVWRKYLPSPLRFLRRGNLVNAWSALAERSQWRRMLSDPSTLDADPFILIHPQSLGFAWCIELIERRRVPTWLYVMDSSFFCVRSYNHVDGESTSCLRCLGGDWRSATQFRCFPSPVNDQSAFSFVHHFRPWLTSRRLGCLVQNSRQADLIRQHCGGDPLLEVIGLWTADLEGLPTREPEAQFDGEYDVVFHGAPVAAKGAHWALEIAARCPSLRFLFPNKRRQFKPTPNRVPENATCVPMSWESGLSEAVRRARVVLVPSLWSATMEGALLKSILTAKAVAVVESPTAYSSELPYDLLLRLPPDPDRAAEILQRAIQNEWQPPRELWQSWSATFHRDNVQLLDRILARTRQ